MRKGGGNQELEDLLRQVSCLLEGIHIGSQLEQIVCGQEEITNLLFEVKKIMAEIPAAQRELIQKFNVFSSAISARIAKLEQAVKDAGGSMTAEQEAAFMAELHTVGVVLEEAGKDPNNPVPPLPPEPSPA